MQNLYFRVELLQLHSICNFKGSKVKACLAVDRSLGLESFVLICDDSNHQLSNQ